jgi:hypothetical protein
MLFLSESIIEARPRLLRDVDRGKITSEQAYRRLLDLEPDDHVALLGMSRLRREAGDLAGAEDDLWRAAQAQPCAWPPYLELSELLSGQEALSRGLSELALSKLLLDEEGLETLGPDPIPPGLDGIEGYDNLNKHEQIQLVVEALRSRRDLEPATVTVRLRPFRLIHQLQDTEDLDAQLVDALVQEGESVVPLLVGVLRGWAQSFLPEDDVDVVENTLALLGEIGHAGAIPHLLEFAVLDNVDLSGAAGWALDRIVTRNPQEAARVFGEIAANLGANERMAVLERLLRHPGLDASGELLSRLSENLDRIPTPDLGAYLPTLVGTMIAARGRAGVELARALMRRHSSRLPRKARRECEDLIEALGDQEAVPPLPAQATPWTVYDICAGNAAWEEEEEEEEDFAPPQQPVLRRPTPGRNDPCWCGSGKKYKKCHLDSDETPQSAAPDNRGEYDRLRSRLGEFLTETTSKRDTRQAQEEFLGDNPVEGDQAPPLIDWMMHDWLPPRLGHTIMQEYLLKHGADLRPRERELVEADGDEILFSKAVYRVVDHKALTTALRSCPEMNEDDEEKHYTWLRGAVGEKGNTVLGNIRVEGAELALETNSKKRHERGKGMLAELAGPALEHLRDDFTTQQEMKRRAVTEPRAPEPVRDEIPPEVRHKLIAEYMEQHNAKWPDLPIPALGGKTPREAVKTAAGKLKVAALLRDFENIEAHKRQAGEPYCDVARLRAELGVKE